MVRRLSMLSFAIVSPPSPREGRRSQARMPQRLHRKGVTQDAPADDLRPTEPQKRA